MTGAFGYTGSFIAERLLAGGRQVRTLNRRPADGHPLGGRIDAYPLRFPKQEPVLWVTFNYDTILDNAIQGRASEWIQVL